MPPSPDVISTNKIINYNPTIAIKTVKVINHKRHIHIHIQNLH